LVETLHRTKIQLSSGIFAKPGCHDGWALIGDKERWQPGFDQR